MEHFTKYFTDAGLKELSDFLRVQQTLGTRKELQKELQERISQECPIKEVQRDPGSVNVVCTLFRSVVLKTLNVKLCP